MNTSRLPIEDCAIATVAGEEHESGYVAIEGGRISAVGSGRPVMESAELRTADEVELSRGITDASRRLAERAEEVAL